MKWLSTINRRDRQLLLVASALIAGMIVLLGVFGPAKMDDDPVPTSWGTGNHGAKAAYLMLGRSGYSIERWTDPLQQLAGQSDGHTVLVIAEPYSINIEEQKKAVETILARGGRVLATGVAGAVLLPHNEAVGVQKPFAEECHTSPTGLDDLARADDVRLNLKSYWQKPGVGDHIQYLCDGKAVIVTYYYGKGHVTWWGDATPLQNHGIAEGRNLDLLLRSVGPPQDAKVYWDESLHGEAPSLWSYVKGTPAIFGITQLTFVAGLLLLSFARRSGPLRPDPKVSRASAGEFVQSLGGLFQRAHASQAPVAIAYRHLRRQMHLNLGVPSTASAQQAADIAARRIPGSDIGERAALLADLQMADRVTEGEAINEAKALTLIQALEQHEARLRLLSKGR